MIGTLLSQRYEILQELESDPVFHSFRAKDRVSGREVRIRLIARDIAQEPEFTAELRRVIEQVSAFQQAGLERIYGMERDIQGTYLVSEALSGSTLEDRLRRLSNFSVPVAVGTAIEICQALQPLHQMGIVHGDISARTVYSTPSDGAKVALPGFWQAYAQSPRAAVGMLKLMAPYLAPEISEGAMPTPSSDVYAIGALLWQLMAGRTPFQGDTAAAQASKHAASPYPSLRTAVASVPQVLDEIIRKAMDKNPLARYPHAGAMLADLRLLLDGLRFGRPLTWPLTPIDRAQATPVAPALNAVKPVPRQQNTRSDPRSDQDGLPIFFIGLFYTSFIVVLLCISSFLSYNVSKPKAVVVPNLIGKSEREAAEALRQLNIKMRVVRRVPSDKVGEGMVLKMNPAPNEDILSHQRVEVTLSSGSEYVVTPNLTGKPVEEARKILDAVGLAASDDQELVHDDNIPDGKVAGQIPGAKQKVLRGAKVRLLISSSAASIENDSKPDPRFGLHHYSLKFRMPKSDHDSRVRIDMIDSHQTRTVMDEPHSGAEKVSVSAYGYGEGVTFKIYFDDVLVKTQTVKAESDSAQ